MNSKTKDIVALVLITCISIIFQHKYISDFPTHIHAWSQSDRYAIALGFERNNLNFFKPETYTLNKQFPDNFTTPYNNSITSVDFPISDYIPAIIMKITNCKSHTIFSICTLIISIIGMFYLYRLSYLFNSNWFLSIFIVIFAISSPVYTYYQAGFLPTIYAISFVCIAMFHYIKYYIDNKTNMLIIAVLFLTLASLVRTTFIITLIAITIFEIISIIFRRNSKQNLLKKIIVFTIAYSFIAIYFLYNMYLRKNYGSIFLNGLMPAKSFDEFLNILHTVSTTWKLHYFSKIQYYILVIFAIISFVIALIKKFKMNIAQKVLIVITIINLCGTILFSLAMILQFLDHDYYFLDSFFLPIIFSLIFITSFIEFEKYKFFKYALPVCLTLITIPICLSSMKLQSTRRTSDPDNRIMITINNFKDAEQFIDSLQIDKAARFLVIDAYAPNIPLILLNRKGYAVMTTNHENIKPALDWDYEYAVIQNSFFISDVYNKYPQIINQLEKIADNGKISICKKSNKQKVLYEFLNINEQYKPLYISRINFDNNFDSLWTNTLHVNYEGNNIGKLTNQEEFGITFKTNNIQNIEGKPRKLLVNLDLFVLDSCSNIDFVSSIIENSTNTYYKAISISSITKNLNNWQTLAIEYELPEIQSNDYEIAWYLWNKNRLSSLNYDNIYITIY